MRSLSTRAAGLLVLAGGVWGGLIPFVGPYFHFVLGPDKAWTWTAGRFWLNVLPAIVAVLGGLILLRSGPYLGGRLGALMGIAAGAWFAVGPDFSYLWNTIGAAGTANGAKGTRVLESLTFHTGLGVAMAAVAAYALPGLLRRVTAAEAGAGDAAAVEAADRRPGARAQRRGLFGRGRRSGADRTRGELAGEPPASAGEGRGPAGPEE